MRIFAFHILGKLRFKLLCKFAFGCGQRSRFDGPNEIIMVINAMLSAASSARIVAKLRKLASEFSELHNDDKRLLIGERRPVSVVLGLRSWELDEFNKLRRKRRTRAAA